MKDSPSAAESCRRLIVFLLCLILLSSCAAQFISSDGGRIKIESIQIDPRGAELSGDLYYPAGTTDEDSYPAVILAPGAGVTKENMRGFAEELARRGYVVLNLNPYGSGLSETPVYNENDMGVDQYNIFATPLGVLDAVNYLRTVEFVDAGRIGLSGHSQGSRRTGYAALMDCGYYTFNDVLLIGLHENFGLLIAEKDVSRDADEVAKEFLTPRELEFYKEMKASYREDYDHMVKSLCLIGSTAQYCNPTAQVEVVGHEVTRTCKVNECVINGQYDFSYLSFNNDPTTKAAWYIPETEDIVNEGYYALDDAAGTSRLVGMFREDTVLENEELRRAIEDRCLRIVMTTPETHSKNFFSAQTTARVIDYFDQTLGNNASEPVTEKSEMLFVWREVFNLIAMLSMVALIVPLAQLLALKPRYAEGMAAVGTPELKKKTFAGIVSALLAVGLGFLAIYWLNAGKSLINFKTTPAFPCMITVWTTPKLLVWLALAGIVTALVYALLAGDFKGLGAFLGGNFRIGFGNILRGVWTGVLFIGLGYLALAACEYFFQQDFRFWMTAFGQLKANHWAYVLSHALLCLPFFFVISLAVNYVSEATLSGRSGFVDVLVTVLLNSLGLWLCCLVNTWLAYSGRKTDGLFSSFILSYGALLLVPINCFILRTSYRKTRSVWVGVVACSLLAGWLMISISGFNGSYVPTTWLSVFLGA